MAKLMNYTGNVIDIFNIQKEDVNAEVDLATLNRT